MHTVVRHIALGFAVALSIAPTTSLGAQAKPSTARELRLDSVAAVKAINCSAELVSYRGRKAMRLLPLPGHESKNESMLAVVLATSFGDGVIELDVAGRPRADADTAARGFIGLAFRVDDSAEHYENFYIRPTNARSDDQARRNHSAQYVSSPDYNWPRLRQEFPAKYESYVDLESGVWTHLRVEVAGHTARLFVNGATQATLIVNDLKLGETRGKIALWSFAETDGYFSNLKVTAK